MLENSMFFETIFHWIFFVLASQNNAKIDIFHIFFENADLAKIIVFHKGNCYFQSFEPPKIKKKLIQRRIRKQHRKKEARPSIFASILASKTVENRSQKRCKTKPVSPRYGNHPEVVGKQRASSFVERPNG